MSSVAIFSSEERHSGDSSYTESCLVTGGTGFVGRHLVQDLVATGNSVTVLSRETRSGQMSIAGDLTSPDLDFSGKSFSTVYHVAGFAHVVPRTQAQRENFFRVNAQGTRNLLHGLERANQLPEAFVLISTVAVYGREQGELLDEDTARNAVDPYGLSKCQAEDAVLEWSKAHGVRASIVRLPLVVGRSAPGNLKLMLGAIMRRRYCGVGSGSARRSMVLAGDVSRILPTIAKVGGTFNLTDGHHPSFYELEVALCKALDRKPPLRVPLVIVKTFGRAGEVLNQRFQLDLPITTAVAKKMSSTLTFSDRRARHVLGWQPELVLENIAELVR